MNDSSPIIEPDVVGLSVMTFQRKTAMAIARLVRTLRPAARVVVGGYDPSLATAEYESCTDIEFVVRGEGEHTFRELLRALESPPPKRPRCQASPGLSYRAAGGFVHNPPRAVIPLASEALRLPNRAARVLGGYTLLGRQVDVVETSRGCTFDCSFCSIIEMRGRNFHPYRSSGCSLTSATLADAAPRRSFSSTTTSRSTSPRFEALCHAIIDAGFDDVDYMVQGMTAPIAQHGARLAPLMRRPASATSSSASRTSSMRIWGSCSARAKNATREHGRTVGNASIAAIEHLHRHGMFVVGGLIVGNPDDTRESIEANLAFARRYVDWPYIQHPTPYPRTPMTRDFRERGLIVDEDVSHYDGTTAVVRSAHMSTPRRSNFCAGVPSGG